MARPRDDFPAYVPVSKRLANGRQALEALAAQRGTPLAPVVLDGKHIVRSFWGRAWCKQLERFSDFASRLPRGRTYLRNGSVLDLQIEPGTVVAKVAGSALYTVRIELEKLADDRWQQIVAACVGKIGSLISLLRGELSADVLAAITDPRTGMFPAPREIKLRCDCPDAAYMCKHVAAVLYGVGARLDHAPELFFVLRQVDREALIASASKVDVSASARAPRSGRRRLTTDAIAQLFDIELDDE